jgi:integrase/recombinase XerD
MKQKLKSNLKQFKKNSMKQNQKIKFLNKVVLTPDEIWRLSNTAVDNVEIKSAFLFCCLTGLRFRDIKVLKWGSVHPKYVQFTPAKPKMSVKIPLGKEAFNELPFKRKGDNDLVFDLPSKTQCETMLNSWAKEAKIDKNLHWNCARLSYTNNLLDVGVDAQVLANLLGHKSLTNMQLYVRFIDEMKSRAIAKLPSICEF